MNRWERPFIKIGGRIYIHIRSMLDFWVRTQSQRT
jgi:hypothetical protein